MSLLDSFELNSLTGLHWLAVVLVVITGVIHVIAGVAEGRAPVALAGVGFFVALVLFLMDYRRPTLYIVGVVYTGIQVPLWYVAKAGEYTTMGYVDKAVQVVLVLVLLYLYWNTRQADSQVRESPAA